jgi:hypothetical protein
MHFFIEKNDFVPVDKMDSGLFNYITEKELICETRDGILVILLPYLAPLCFAGSIRYIVNAFPTVKPLILLRKKNYLK